MRRQAACTGGSSPRPWGTRRAARHQRRRLRFIPTSVGNTPAPAAPPPPTTVHPHVRGEHCPGEKSQKRIAGSSPRPWGTLGAALCDAVPGRFIPTSVGNTQPCWLTSTATAVHPHVRGEHQRGLTAQARKVGSSPRPWGTPPAEARKLAPMRFIPTSVGNTSRPASRRHRRSVHPHVRGEHNRRFAVLFAPCGSSPRPWGTPPTCSGW